MGDAATRKIIVTELYNRYQANGFITEDEALACFAAQKTPISEIDSITEHLLALGVIIKIEDDDYDIEGFRDRSKLDYNEIFEEVLYLEPGLVTFIEYVRNITPPQNRETQNLISQVHNGNQYARNRLIEMYLRTVIKQALYHCKRYNLPLEDTIQDGILGLIIAIEKYDPAEHEKFSTYAPWWTRQSIQRQMGFSPLPLIYFPAHVQERLYTIYEIVKDHFYDCCNESGFCPNLISKISQKLSCSEETSKNLLSYYNPILSIESELDSDEQLFSDYGRFEEKLLDTLNINDMEQNIPNIIKLLSEREQKVVNLRFGILDGKARTLEEVGTIMGVTRERIRQIEAKAIKRLRHPTKSKILRAYI